MHITVIVPSFNSSAFFTKCLFSIQLSGNNECQVLVVDNCSTDQTISDFMQFSAPSISLGYVSEKDSGPAQALNTGFKLALADSAVDIIGWLNSDDCYASGAIDRALAAFKANPKLKIVYGLGQHIDEHGKDLGAYPTLDSTTNIKSFTDGSFICQPTVFFRKEVFEEVGFLDESLKTAFDFDFWLRIFKHYPRSRIGFINKVQAYSRLHSQCLTKRLRKTVALESMAVIARHLKFAPSHWILTYFDEICERYPFVDEPESLLDNLKSFLTSAKPFVKPAEFAKLVKRLEGDWRLRLSNQQLYVGVQPDGWVSKRLVVKLRYPKDGAKTISLKCRGSWPLDANLNLRIRSAAGDVEMVKLGTQDQFILRLEAPETSTQAFTAWTIETNQSFVPARELKRSKDKRHLSFKVEGVELS